MITRLKMFVSEREIPVTTPALLFFCTLGRIVLYETGFTSGLERAASRHLEWRPRTKQHYQSTTGAHFPWHLSPVI
jgi:hypothetical protein